MSNIQPVDQNWPHLAFQSRPLNEGLKQVCREFIDASISQECVTSAQRRDYKKKKKIPSKYSKEG